MEGTICSRNRSDFWGFSCLYLYLLLPYLPAALLALASICGCSSANGMGASSTSQSSTSSQSGQAIASTEPVVFIGDSVTALFASAGFGQPEWSQHPNWTK